MVGTRDERLAASHLQARARALKRMVMWKTLSDRLPLYLVSEFPKCGGTWFARMLAEGLVLPFARNTASTPLRSSVLAGHHLADPRFRNVCVVYRDGRDAALSYYHYMLFDNDVAVPGGFGAARRALSIDDPENVTENLPRFLEYLFNGYAERRNRFTWAQFVRSWQELDVVSVKYEDLLTQAEVELGRVIEELTGSRPAPDRLQTIVDGQSFERVSGRSRGDESRSSFVRKGVAGDWKNHFNEESRQVFDRYAGDELILLGYEQDRQWVRNESD